MNDQPQDILDDTTKPELDENTVTPRSAFVWRHQYEEAADRIIGHQCRLDSDQRLTELKALGITDAYETEQHHKDNVDLNVIAQRMGVQDFSRLPLATDPRHYGTVPEGLDLRAVLDEANRVQQNFEQLPAKIKDRFHNDPAALWRFLQDDTNDEEAVRLGLLKKPEPKKAPEPIAVRVIPEPPTT